MTVCLKEMNQLLQHTAQVQSVEQKDRMTPPRHRVMLDLEWFAMWCF